MSGRNTRQSLASATRSSGRLTPASKAVATPVNKKRITKEDIEALAAKKNQPLKKRPLPASISIPVNKKVPIQKTGGRRTITPPKSGKQASASNFTPTSETQIGRSRRTPKPNPKYTNENLVTAFNAPPPKSRRYSKSGSDDDDNDEFLSERDTEDVNSEDDEIFSDIDDSSDYDEFENEKVTRSSRTAASSFNSMRKIGMQSKVKTSTPNIAKQTIKPGIRSILTASMDKQKLQSSMQSNILRKRKFEQDHNKDSPVNKCMSITGKLSDEERTKRFQILKAQLELKNKQQQQKPTPEQQKKLLDALKAARSQQQSKMLQLKENDFQKKPSPKISKKLDDEDDDDDKDEDKDPIGNDDATAATLDDFETMPTFTIVNVHDIIGKKGNVLLEKSEDMDNDGKINNTKIVITSPKSKKEAQIARDKKNIMETISLLDSSMEGRTTRSSTLSNNASRNRRKTMHTTILSDKIDKLNDKPPPRTPFPPPRKQAPPNVFSRTSAIKKFSNNTPEPRPLIKRSNNGNINIKNKTSSMESLKLTPSPQIKPSPRILNSIVGKKPTPIISITTKASQPTQLLKNLKTKENQQLNLALSNKSSESPTTSPSPSQSLKRKSPQLPSEKVVIQRQGNKIIKKITCFETWYVINLPKEEPDDDEPKKTVPPVGRKISGILNKTTNNGNHLKIPLIQLANTIENVKLPSDKWIPKVTLQKIPTTPKEMYKKELNKKEKYTGKISDSNFSENDRDSLTPLNVMFRRVPLNPTPKLPYDRAVIFKNQTFFTNIDGKNIKLVDAPKEIENTVDIEILLEIIDDLKLNSTFVEPTSYLG